MATCVLYPNWVSLCIMTLLIFYDTSLSFYSLAIGPPFKVSYPILCIDYELAICSHDRQ